MAIQATFTADTKPLEAGLDRAAAKIAGVRKSSEETGRSLKAMGSSFDGTKTEGTALRIAASIQKVGGAVKLTDAEWKRADRTVSDVLQKYERMGTVAPAAVQALRRELDHVKTSATQAASALGSVGGSVSKGLGAIAGGLGIGIGAGLGLGALTALGSTIKELAGDAARLSPLQQSFERLQGGAGNAGQALVSLRIATKGLVSDADLLQASNKGSLLGLGAMGIKFDEVAKVATTLGRAMGQDAAKSVDDLTTALSRMSPQILDNLGIKVDLTAATEAYAKSLGKSVESLSEEEKKMAFATAAMEAAREKASQLGEITLTVAEQSERIAIAFADMGAQALSAGNKSVTFAGQLGQVADAIDRIRNAPGATGDKIARTLSQAGQWATSKAEQVERDAPWYLSALASSGMAPLALGGFLARGAAPFIGNTSPLTVGMFPPIASHGGGGAVGGGASGGGGGAPDAPAKIKKISDAQRELNTQVEKAFKTSKQAGQGWEEYAGNLQLARMEMEQFIATQPDDLIGAKHPLSAIMGGPYQYQISGNGSGLKAQIEQTRDWRAEVRGVAQAFGTLAQIAGPTLDGISRSVGTVFGSANAADSLIGALGSLFPSLQTKDAKGNLVMSQRGKNIAGVVGSATTGASLGSMTSNMVVGGALGAGGGLATGLMAGATGAMLGASVGVGAAAAIYMAWRNRQAEKKALSEQRAQVIASAGGYDEFQKAVERAGFEFDHFLEKFNSNDADTFTEGMNRLNVAIAEQQTRAKKLVDGLNEVARVQGVLSRQQFAQIRNLRPGDAGVEEVLAFAQGQRQQAESGVIRAVNALQEYGANALTDFGQAAKGAAGGLYALFSEAIAQGESAIDVLARLGPSIDTLTGFGVTGAGFDSLKVQQGIVTGAQTGPAAQLGAGLGQALAGFANSGLLSPELFGELANGIGEAYKAIENLGQGGLEAARLFQPYLQSIDKMIRDNPALEEQLDDQTKSLLAFAREAGLIGPKFDSAADRILSALDRLIGKLDEFIGRMATAAGITIPTPGTPGPPTEGVPGGSGANGGDYTVGAAGYGTMGVATSAPMGGGVSQVITVQLGRETIARAVAEDLPRIVSVYGGVF